MASYLQIENISKSYGPKVLFDHIGFNVNEGDKIALIAPNGTGKTSLNLFLDVPIDFVDARLKEQREGCDRDYLEGKSDIHEADLGFQVRVRKHYLGQCALDPGFIRIDCGDENGLMLPPDDIFAKVRAAVDPFLA